MRRWEWYVILLCLLSGCGSGSIGPATAPVRFTPVPEPSGTLNPASPTVLPKPTAPPPPSSPTPPPQSEAWWDGAVFYEIFVRSFYDSDGDGSGDLQGLVAKLEYLNDGDPAAGDDLGVTGLWLMPISASSSYHGYDVTDYRTINPDYGTSEEFKRLIDEAHRRGMRVIVDLVLNHTSDQHPWFLDSASGPDAARREWYIWSETDPGYLGPDGQQVWHPRNGAYYYGLFGRGMPDLNMENAGVTAELYDMARFWVEEMGVDGFRLDAAKHYVEAGKVQVHTPATHAWLRDFYAFCKSVAPEMLTVGEIWDVSDLVATYIGNEVDLAFEFSLAKAILLSVNEDRVTPLASAMKEIQRLYPEGGYATFLTNHDQNRVMDALGRDPEKARLAATVLLTLPGVPFVYYGEEIGMTGSKPDPSIRTPMQWTSGPNAGFTAGTPWEPVNEDHGERNVEIQLSEPGSLFHHYRTLIALRNAHPALGRGAFFPVGSADGRVLAFLRHTQGEQVLVVINFAQRSTTDYALGVAESPLPPGGYTVTELLTGTRTAPLTVGPGGGLQSYQPWPELPPRGALILELAPTKE